LDVGSGERALFDLRPIGPELTACAVLVEKRSSTRFPVFPFATVAFTITRCGVELSVTEVALPSVVEPLVLVIRSTALNVPVPLTQSEPVSTVFAGSARPVFVWAEMPCPLAPPAVTTFTDAAPNFAQLVSRLVVTEPMFTQLFVFVSAPPLGIWFVVASQTP